MDHPEGLYGSQLIKLSDGYLGRGTIYTLFDRLVTKGYVREEKESPTQSYGIARTRHYITGLGRSAVVEYAHEMGFTINPSIA